MVAKPKRLPFYNTSKHVKYEGLIDVLKGHIYDCTDSHQADLYTKMTKEIAIYVVTALKNRNGGNISKQTHQLPRRGKNRNGGNISQQTHQLPRRGTGRIESMRSAKKR